MISGDEVFCRDHKKLGICSSTMFNIYTSDRGYNLEPLSLPPNYDKANEWTKIVLKYNPRGLKNKTNKISIFQVLFLGNFPHYGVKILCLPSFMIKFML